MISLVVSIVLLVVKFAAFNLTHSQSIYSDAVESIVNVVAAGMALLVIWYSAKPKDEDHPYGHGKIEFFSAAFEGGLIAFASLLIISEAIQAWWHGQAPSRLKEGLLLVAGAGLANLALGLFLVSRGKKFQSVALRASGTHVISDFYTSAGVILGLILVKLTGANWIDQAAAVIVGGWLGWNGFGLVKESIGGLMDREDPEALRSLAQVFSERAQAGIIQIHHVRMIRSGWYHHIDAHVVIPENWDVKRVHEAINAFEKAVIKRYDYGGEMNFHVDPCRRAYCRVCDVRDCPIRQEPFAERIVFDVAQIRSPVEPQEFLLRRRK